MGCTTSTHSLPPTPATSVVPAHAQPISYQRREPSAQGSDSQNGTMTVGTSRGNPTDVPPEQRKATNGSSPERPRLKIRVQSGISGQQGPTTDPSRHHPSGDAYHTGNIKNWVDDTNSFQATKARREHRQQQSPTN